MDPLSVLPPGLAAILSAGEWPKGFVQNHRLGTVRSELADQQIELKRVSADGRLNIGNIDSALVLREFFPAQICRVLRDDEASGPVVLPYIDGSKVWTMGTGNYGDEFYLLLDYSLSQTEPRVLVNIGYPQPLRGSWWNGKIEWICVAECFAEFWKLMR